MWYSRNVVSDSSPEKCHTMVLSAGPSSRLSASRSNESCEQSCPELVLGVAFVVGSGIISKACLISWTHNLKHHQGLMCSQKGVSTENVGLVELDYF